MAQLWLDPFYVHCKLRMYPLCTEYSINVIYIYVYRHVGVHTYIPNSDSIIQETMRKLINVPHLYMSIVYVDRYWYVSTISTPLTVILRKIQQYCKFHVNIHYQMYIHELRMWRYTDIFIQAPKVHEPLYHRNDFKWLLSPQPQTTCRFLVGKTTGPQIF